MKKYTKWLTLFWTNGFHDQVFTDLNMFSPISIDSLWNFHQIALDVRKLSIFLQLSSSQKIYLYLTDSNFGCFEKLWVWIVHFCCLSPTEQDYDTPWYLFFGKDFWVIFLWFFVQIKRKTKPWRFNMFSAFYKCYLIIPSGIFFNRIYYFRSIVWSYCSKFI